MRLGSCRPGAASGLGRTELDVASIQMRRSYLQRFISLGCLIYLAACNFSYAETRLLPAQKYSRIVIIENPNAMRSFDPNPECIEEMVGQGILAITEKPSVSDAWLSLVKTQDVVGIKVSSALGAISGTRPSVVQAVIKGLILAGVPSRQIVIWDKHLDQLRQAGFVQLAGRLGVQAAGCVDEGYDESVFYEAPVLGQLVNGDVEFGKKEYGVGRKSFVSRLLTKRLTRIIHIVPMVNDELAGVTGNLYGISAACVDNFRRFELTPGKFVEAVPEIYIKEQIGDKVALSIVDALICQYQAGQQALHYSATLNQLRFSKDPVALDILSIQEIQRQRQRMGMAAIPYMKELYQNAAFLEMGLDDDQQFLVDLIKPK